MAYTSLLQWVAPRLYKQTLTGTIGFTTDFAADDYIHDAGHGLLVGDLIEFQQTTTIQTPLVVDTVYQVFHVQSSSEFSITLNGISVVSIADDGSNDNTYKVYSTNVTLENFVVTQDAPQDRAFWQESIINNHREIANTDKMHWALGFEMNLFNEGTLATRRTNFDELFGYLYTDVYVSRCNVDGSASILIRDSNGLPSTFVMDVWSTSFLSQSKFDEVLTIGLKSKDPIDMSETV